MQFYKSTKNTKSIIKKLKEDLMDKNKTSTNTSDSVISSIRQTKNEKIGKVIENNIRNILQQYFNFEKIDFPHKVYIKKISYENDKKEIELIQNEETMLTIEKINFKFLFDEKFNIKINFNDNTPIDTIESKYNNAKETFIIKNTDIKITTYPYREMEFDGFFKIRNFSKNQFDEKEASILYSNIINEREENFRYCMIEVKKGSKKVNELITQIKKDNNLMKLNDINPAIILGFINENAVKDINHFNTLKNINCAIYGIKNSILCGKDITKSIDWDLNKKVTELASKVDVIYNYILSKMEQEKELRKKKERKTQRKKEKEEKSEEEEEQSEVEEELKMKADIRRKKVGEKKKEEKKRIWRENYEKGKKKEKIFESKN